MLLPEVHRSQATPGSRQRSAGRCAVTLALLGFAVAGIGAEPQTAAPAWHIERGSDPHAGDGTCLLVSRPMTMADGYGPASVQLIFGARALRVVTDSNIDSSYPDQGLVIDDGPLIGPDAPFPLDARSALFEQRVEDITEQFRRGYVARLHLGFWPTWPVTQTQTLDISLTGFSRAHDDLLSCRESSAERSE